jgi:signal transduction histidine kinase
MPVKKQVHLLAIVTITYILLALTWWTILLYDRTNALFEQQLEMRTLQDRYQLPELAHLPEEAQLMAAHQRQRRMILGESIFILVSILVGIWLMLRGLWQEIRINRQRRNFLLSITHELKTPLAAIQLVFDTLLRRELNPDQLRQIALTGKKETGRLGDTLSNLLLAARLGSRYVPHLESRPLDTTLRIWAEDFRAQYPGLPLEMSIHKTLTSEVRLDWRGLETALRNLVDNAVKYAGIHTPIHIQVDQREQTLLMRISDEGPGIADHEKRKVFGMFYRPGDEEKRHSQGSGLGLYIVQQIIEASGGQVRLTDHHPRGCIFTIELPLHP